MAASPRTSGADLIWSTLQQLGLRTVFGLPGTQTVPLYDSLKRSDLKTILSTSELTAAFAANGYYRATGRPAAIVTIPGPGVTMATTGLLEALHDSVALLHLTVRKAGERPKFDLQRIDMWSYSAATAKRFVSIESVDQVVERLTEAWSLATRGEPGPVIVEIDLSVMSDMADAVPPHESEPRPVDKDEIDTIVTRLSASRHPVFFCGQGCNGSARYVRQLAEQTGAAILTTCSGRGVVPEDHPLVIPVDFSNSAWPVVQQLFDQSDLILALGCKLSHNGTAGFRLNLPQEKLIHVDTSSDVLNSNYPACLAVTADLRVILPTLIDRLAGVDMQSVWSADHVSSIRRQLDYETDRVLEHFPHMTGIRPESLKGFFDTLRELTDPDAIIVTDSGLHQIATRAFWRVQSERGLIVPSDYQSMGFGIPAAIGAAVGVGKRKIVAVVGDGGLGMTGMEIGVAVRENLDLTVIVFSDGYLGQIRLQQLSDGGDDHAVAIPPLNLEAWATAQQLSFSRLEGDLTASLRAALSLAGPRLMELPLTDSPKLDRIRSIQSAKQQARRLLGSRPTGWLKRIFGKSGL